MIAKLIISHLLVIFMAIGSVRGACTLLTDTGNKALLKGQYFAMHDSLSRRGYLYLTDTTIQIRDGSNSIWDGNNYVCVQQYETRPYMFVYAEGPGSGNFMCIQFIATGHVLMYRSENAVTSGVTTVSGCENLLRHSSQRAHVMVEYDPVTDSLILGSGPCPTLLPRAEYMTRYQRQTGNTWQCDQDPTSTMVITDTDFEMNTCYTGTPSYFSPYPRNTKLQCIESFHPNNFGTANQNNAGEFLVMAITLQGKTRLYCTMYTTDQTTLYFSINAGNEDIAYCEMDQTSKSAGVTDANTDINLNGYKAFQLTSNFCPHECLNSATCTQVLGSFTCICKEGYTGLKCETDINECANQPCLNKGTCHDEENRFKCVCPDGYTGTICETKVCSTDDTYTGVWTGQSNVMEVNVTFVSFVSFVAGTVYQCEIEKDISGFYYESMADTSLFSTRRCIRFSRETNGDNTNIMIYQLSPEEFLTTGRIPIGSCPAKFGQNIFNIAYLSSSASSMNIGNQNTPLTAGTFQMQWQINGGAVKCGGSPLPLQAKAIIPGSGNSIQFSVNDACFTGAGNTYGEPVKVTIYYVGSISKRTIDGNLNGDNIILLAFETGLNSYQFYCTRYRIVDNQIFLSMRVADSSNPVCESGKSAMESGNGYMFVTLTSDQCQRTSQICSSSLQGECSNLMNDYLCTCKPGFTGRDCETNIGDCDNHACQHGTCIDQVNSYTCQCEVGWSEQFCTVYDTCGQTAPCQNGAVCSNIAPTDYECECVPGYTGKNCETDIDECASTPCQFSGTCTDFVNRYECECVPGVSGDQCQTDIQQCQSNPCQHAGTCVETPAQIGQGYKCLCEEEWDDGCHCENANECVSNPCQNGATCQDLYLFYRCLCKPAFTGSHCEDNLLGDLCEPNPCTHDGDCAVVEGDAACTCKAGYTGTRCEDTVSGGGDSGGLDTVTLILIILICVFVVAVIVAVVAIVLKKASEDSAANKPLVGDPENSSQGQGAHTWYPLYKHRDHKPSSG